MTDVICSKCGEELKEGSKFCVHCGTKLKKICVKCGKQIKIGKKFCKYCGSKQEEMSDSKKAPMPTPVAAPTPPVEPSKTPPQQPQPDVPATTPVITPTLPPLPPAKKPDKLIVGIVAVVIAAMLIIAGSWIILQQPQKNYTEYQQSIDNFNDVFASYVNSATSMQQSNIDLVSTLTNNFQTDLTSVDNIDTSAALAFIDQMNEETPNYAQSFLDGYQFLENWINVQDLSESAHHSLILTAIFIAGIALLGCGAYKAVKNAVNKNVDVAERSIEDATDAQLIEINKELGLPVDSSKGGALAEFQRARDEESLADVNDVTKRILEIETQDTDISSLKHADEVKQAQVEAAVELGEAGVKTYVGAITTVTGGQGISQLGEVVGLSAEVAAAVDLGVSAVGYQPLDILGENCQVAVASDEQKEIIIDKPEQPMSEAEAIEIIKKVADDKLDEITLSEFTNSIDTIASGVAEKCQIDLETEDHGDYYVVKVPDKIHLQSIEDLQNSGIIQIPGFGSSDIMIGTADKVPDIMENINTSEYPNIGLDWKNLEDAEPYNPETYSLSVVASPYNPDPSQNVLVTARITPATEGVEIYFHISGTDGYTNSATHTTDSSGKATFSIPGGAGGIVDTVTVRIEETGTEKVFSYVF